MENSEIHQTLSNPEHETVRIPDFILLREIRKDVLKLKAEIEELHELNYKKQLEIESLLKLTKKENTEINNLARIEARKNEFYANQLVVIKATEIAIRKYKESNEALIIENIKLRRQLNIPLNGNTDTNI